MGWKNRGSEGGYLPPNAPALFFPATPATFLQKSWDKDLETPWGAPDCTRQSPENLLPALDVLDEAPPRYGESSALLKSPDSI